ncbi:hypothetical protein [Bradyrhizobium manausense]|uniref:Uncharacterized protein n=1 Tax=Bradyrhizobium manausense TaxID=989370 RepID=A0A0R3DK13_9BRAD|nr:hypothetical protein [Bradyrhizobium manausense]KRQ10169.1 hypothetical protein AOQ71_19560 [Bradyrhizobium manausense]
MSQNLKIPADVVGRLELVGRALHGNRWQRPLTAVLGVSHVAFSRWVKGGCMQIDVELLKFLRDRARDRRRSRGIRRPLLNALAPEGREMAQYDAWSKHEFHKATAMHGLGTPPTEIRRAIGPTVDTVEAMVYRKLSLPRISARTADVQRVEWIVENLRKLSSLVREGKQIEEIAVEFRTTTSAIWTTISRHNVRSGSILRTCMCCIRPFFFEGYQNRLCSNCSTGEMA